jgi:SAM-dependent methyltransferase
MIDTTPYEWLIKLNSQPKPYSQYTTIEMWNDEHISEQMLVAHLDETSNSASRNKAFIHRSAEWTRSYFPISHSTEIIDFGCGPGLYTNEWARMGANVTGIDVSLRSIEYAKKVAENQRLPIKYIRDNYLEHDFSHRYDLITMIFCDYCVLNPHQRRQLLGKWRSILRPNGKILFDVSSLKYFKSVEETRSYEYNGEGGFWSSMPYFSFYNVYRYKAEQLLLEQYTIVESKRIRTFYNWLQCFSLETIELELKKAGFMMREFFGNVAGDRFSDDCTEIAIVAENAT